MRRVECDEAKPACYKCTSSGRHCNGYDPPKSCVLALQTKYCTATPAQIPPSVSPDTEIWIPSERRAHLFFRTQTVPILKTFDAASRNLWDFIVPQISHLDPAIKHMMLATASSQEILRLSPHQAQQHIPFSLQQRSKGVALLTRSGNPPPTEVILISCILMVVCEKLRGRTADKWVHIKAGSEILRAWKSLNHETSTVADSPAYIIQTYIEPIFKRLLEEVSVHNHLNLPVSSISPTDNVVELSVPKWRLNIPTSFQNMHAARESLFNVVRQIFTVMKRPAGVAVGVITMRDNKHLLSSWVHAFRGLPEHSSPQMIIPTDSIMLAVHHQVVSILLEASVFTTESAYDNFTVEFKNILAKIALHIERQRQTTLRNKINHEKPLPQFSHDLGLLAPLFVISTRCREPTLRRQALRVMGRLHRTEGVWDSCAAVSVAERIINIEEKGLARARSCADIPESHRIKVLNAAPHGDVDSDLPGMMLRFTRAPYKKIEQALIPWGAFHLQCPELVGSKPQSMEHWMGVHDGYIRTAASSTNPPWLPPQDMISLGGYQGHVPSVEGICLCTLSSVRLLGF